MDKTKIITQTKHAFDFMQKLYLEVSYLIKEVEGLLGEEEERFIIGRPSGYQANMRTSAGLEPNQVHMWLPRNMAVFFVPEQTTQSSRGMTFTDLSPATKVIYLRVILDSKEKAEPVLHAGILYGFEKQKAGGKFVKFEQVLTHIEYRDNQVFQNIGSLEYSDSYIHFRGNLFEVPLYDLHTSQDVMDKVVKRSLVLFREANSK